MAKDRPRFDEVYRSFHWGTVLRDLEWDGAEISINLGHTIIDRHAESHHVALYWFGKDGSSAAAGGRAK